MTNPEKFYRVKLGDTIRAKYGSFNGMTGTVVKIFNNPPSIDAGFNPNHHMLGGFAVGKNGLVNVRLEPNEFEVLDKTTYSHPSKRMN